MAWIAATHHQEESRPAMSLLAQRPDGVPTGLDFQQERWARIERAVALSCVLLLGLRLSLPFQIPLGFVLLGITAPLWLRVVRQGRQATRLLILTLLALLSGLLLAIYASADHQLARGSLAGTFALATLTFGGAFLVFWCAELTGERMTGITFGLGLMAGVAIHGYASTLNMWKGGWGTSIAITVLALCGRRRGATVIALIVFGVVSAFFDTRSYFAIFMIAALIELWSMIPTVSRRHRSWLGFASALLALSVAAYLLGSQALVAGYLGPEAQQRSIEQIDASGTLILGGRPEAGAAVALFLARPIGFGFGVQPTTGDVLVAKQGLAAINYDPNNGYVDGYMFGSGFELHSVVGDMWVLTGVVGLILVAAVAIILIRHLALALADRRLTGLSLFLSLWSLWNLLFSPLLSSYLSLMLALGLALHSEHAANRDDRAGHAS
jgi:hypothetical protein